MELSNGYASQLKTSDILTADVTLGATTAWTEIGSYQVPDGTAIMLGNGSLIGQDNAQGRLYFDIIDDAAGAEDGMIRIVAVNPTQTKEFILFQGSTTKGRSGDADTRAAQIPLPEQKDFVVPENWYIKIKMKPDAAGDVVDVSACTFLCDVIAFDYRP